MATFVVGGRSIPIYFNETAFDRSMPLTDSASPRTQAAQHPTTGLGCGMPCNSAPFEQLGGFLKLEMKSACALHSLVAREQRALPRLWSRKWCLPCARVGPQMPSLTCYGATLGIPPQGPHPRLLLSSNSTRVASTRQGSSPRSLARKLQPGRKGRVTRRQNFLARRREYEAHSSGSFLWKLKGNR